jgi:hypothetical protein
VRALFVADNAHARGFLALRTNKHHIGNRNGRFQFDAAGVDVTTLAGLRLALVLGSQVDSLHNYTPFFEQDVDNFSALPFVFQTSVDDLNGITFSYLYFHGVNSNTT